MVKVTNDPQLYTQQLEFTTSTQSAGVPLPTEQNTSELVALRSGLILLGFLVEELAQNTKAIHRLAEAQERSATAWEDLNERERRWDETSDSELANGPAT